MVCGVSTSEWLSWPLIEDFAGQFFFLWTKVIYVQISSSDVFTYGCSGKWSLVRQRLQLCSYRTFILRWMEKVFQWPNWLLKIASRWTLHKVSARHRFLIIVVVWSALLLSILFTPIKDTLDSDPRSTEREFRRMQLNTFLHPLHNAFRSF